VPLAEDARVEALMEALEPTLVQLDAATTRAPAPLPTAAPKVVATTARPAPRSDVAVVLGAVGALSLSPALVLARRRRTRGS
jgi:hypothetical protein